MLIQELEYELDLVVEKGTLPSYQIFIISLQFGAYDFNSRFHPVVRNS